MTLGRLIVSDAEIKNDGRVTYIMGIPGLHLSWADEVTARVLLQEFELPGQDFRVLAFDERAACRLLARSGFVGCKPHLCAKPQLLDMWAAPQVRYPSEPQFRKPKFKDKMHGIVAAAYGVPFWRSSGLWTTDECADYVEGKLTFDNLIGFSILKGLEDRSCIIRAASVLQTMDVEW